MILGLLSSPNPAERRVALVPPQVWALVRRGVQVLVESGVGVAAGYPDAEFEAAGGRIVYDRVEALARPDVILCPDRPTRDELALIKEGAILAGLVNRFGTDRGFIAAAQEAGARLIALEEVKDEAGAAILRRRFAQIAGTLCPTIAGHLMQSAGGKGHGILLGAIPGFPSVEIVIVGAGVLGLAAARAFSGAGCQVTLLDTRAEALEAAEALSGRVNTRLSGPSNLLHALSYADVVVTSAAVPGQPAPVLITQDDVSNMPRGSLLMDLAIDQGGNAETSRPIYALSDAWEEHDTLHFAMPNLPALVARTSSKVFSATVTPWLLGLARGDEDVIRRIDAATVTMDGDEAVGAEGDGR